jgi:hypothetical protein
MDDRKVHLGTRSQACANARWRPHDRGPQPSPWGSAPICVIALSCYRRPERLPRRQAINRNSSSTSSMRRLLNWRLFVPLLRILFSPEMREMLVGHARHRNSISLCERRAAAGFDMSSQAPTIAATPWGADCLAQHPMTRRASPVVAIPFRAATDIIPHRIYGDKENGRFL